MPKKQLFTPEQVVAALRNHRGLVTQAAKELGIGVRTVYDYVQRYASVREVVQEMKESRLDYTEGKLYDLIDKGEPAAIFFHLKTQGKHRGWVERQELTGADGESIRIRFVEEIVDQPDCRVQVAIAPGPEPVL